MTPPLPELPLNVDREQRQEDGERTGVLYGTHRGRKARDFVGPTMSHPDGPLRRAED